MQRTWPSGEKLRLLIDVTRLSKTRVGEGFAGMTCCCDVSPFVVEASVLLVVPFVVACCFLDR